MTRQNSEKSAVAFLFGKNFNTHNAFFIFWHRSSVDPQNAEVGSVVLTKALKLSQVRQMTQNKMTRYSMCTYTLHTCYDFDREAFSFC